MSTLLSRASGLLAHGLACHVADDLSLHHVNDHLGNVGSVVTDALKVFCYISEADRPGDVFGVLQHIEEKLVEYLLVQVVHEVVGLAYAQGEVSVLCHKGIQAVLEHLLGRLGHARDVDVRLEGRLIKQLDPSFAYVYSEVAHALEVGDDLDRGRDEAEIAARGLPDGDEPDALLLDLHVEIVSDGITVDNLDSEVPVTLDQGPDGFLDGILNEPAHLEYPLLELFEVLFFLPGHWLYSFNNIISRSE